MGCCQSQAPIHPEIIGESLEGKTPRLSPTISPPSKQKTNTDVFTLPNEEEEDANSQKYDFFKQDPDSSFNITSQSFFIPDPTTGIGAFPSFFNPETKPKIFEYQFFEHIGKGARSDVFRVENTDTGIEYAAKVYDKNYLFRTCIGDAEPPIVKFSDEVKIMSTLTHPNCLKMVELLDDECTNSMVMILPFAKCGSLSPFSWKATPISEHELHYIFSQVASGLAHMHELNIIHRDIKPENILRLDENCSVISDFSASLALGDSSNIFLEDTDGTPAFYSPEECSGNAYLGKPADIWAFGMTMYVMAVGKLPFLKSDDFFLFSQFYKIANSIMNEEITYPSNLSPALVNIMKHMLDKNPETRYTIEQVLADPWMASK